MKTTIKQIINPHFFYRFLFWTLLLQLLVWQIETTAIMINTIEHGLAKLSGFIYSFYSSQWLVDGNKIIHSDSLRFIYVDHSCTGLSLIATLTAAFLSLSLAWRKKLILVIFATLLIQIENTLRITHLFHLVQQVDNNFTFFHLYFWQFINFISALLIFYGLALSKYKV
jgi:exosortase/archaeosortase family protein